MAVLGLRFCERAFSSCSEQGTLLIVVCGSLTITASLVVEHRLQMCRLSNFGSRAQLLRGVWHLPRPGLKPVSPALAGRFSTTVPPGKPPFLLFLCLLPVGNVGSVGCVSFLVEGTGACVLLDQAGSCLYGGQDHVQWCVLGCL